MTMDFLKFPRLFGRARGAKPSRVWSFALALLVVGLQAFGGVPKVGDKAADYEWEALGGGKIKLSSVTKKSPVVLVVLRGYPGYQCPICTRQVAELISNAAKFEKARAQVLLVYPGPADGLKDHASEFVSGKDLPKNFRFVLDPNFTFTKKYDLRWDAPNETAYPSTFVIDRKGKIRFAKISHEHGDRAKTEEVLRALGK